jgi:hypothetical protein
MRRKANVGDSEKSVEQRWHPEDEPQQEHGGEPTPRERLVVTLKS